MVTAVANLLNRKLSLNLPPNACHTYIDLESITNEVLGRMKNAVPIPVAEPLTPQSSSHFSNTTMVNESIAIVGQAIRLPGDINTPESLWEALITKRKDIMTRTPEDRWDHSSFNGEGPCQITFEKAGFIDIAGFDTAFFGIPPAEAVFVSPTVRLTLELAFEALENANIPISRVRGTDMGVFVAAGLDTGYDELLYHDKGYDGMRYSVYFWLI